MTREIETWLSDSRVGNNSVVELSTEADDQSSLHCIIVLTDAVRLKCVSIRLWCGCGYLYCGNLLWRGCVYVGVGVTEAQCKAADKQSECDWSASQSGAWRRPEVQVAAAEGARRRQGDLTEPRSYSITRGVSFLLVQCIVSNSLNISWHCCTCPWGLRSRVLTHYHLICLKNVKWAARAWQCRQDSRA